MVDVIYHMIDVIYNMLSSYTLHISHLIAICPKVTVIWT